MKGSKFLHFILFASIPLLFINDLYRHNTLLEKRLWDFGHLPLFMALAFASLPYLTQAIGLSKNKKLTVLKYFGSIVVLGMVIEIVQWVTGRNASFSDLRKDTLGALLIYLCFYFRDIKSRPIRWVSWVVALLWLGFESQPVTEAAIDRWRMNASMPVLADFETQAELTRWNGGRFQRAEMERDFPSESISDYSPNTINHALMVSFHTDGYSGIVGDGLHSDWRGFKALKMDINNPSAAFLKLNIKIEDRVSMGKDRSYQNRYNGMYTLQPGDNEVRISLDAVSNAPHSRVIDLGDVARLSLFFNNAPQKGHIYIDNVTLLEVD
ncbi:MAG: VanZ family protein [Gammaproteobacteria bacterium]|nr:VanZ family protein [Gammaproteobacteria bacterium]